jgi:hypothetical protein
MRAAGDREPAMGGRVAACGGERRAAGRAAYDAHRLRRNTPARGFRCTGGEPVAAGYAPAGGCRGPAGEPVAATAGYGLTEGER